uniref:Uncharacterized protein n=1 Tax=Magallana gigas TaxID=29159 RepID=A0A8W8J1X1_MAGGI|nr:C-type mannose receptor 2 [Crassostrea gigas]
MVVCDLAVIVLCCLVSLGGCELPGLVFYGKRSDPLFTYSTLSPSGIQQCVRACFLDRACNSVNFDRSQLTCHLNSREVQPDSLTSDSDFVFITNISGSQNLTKDCSQNNCGQEESCINLKNGSTCIKTVCPRAVYSYDNSSNTCYRIVDHLFLNWTAAEDFCQKDGAHLISLRTENQTNFISEQLKINYIHTNLTEYWIGLSDREVEGAFRWVDGQSVGFSNWGDNQPNNRDVNCVSNGTFEADCTVIRKNGRWADDCCGDSKAFICEIV